MENVDAADDVVVASNQSYHPTHPSIRQNSWIVEAMQFQMTWMHLEISTLLHEEMAIDYY
jgi:hypothetical protein